VSRTLGTMLFLTIPAAAGLMVLRYPIASLLFRHGVFSAHDLDLVASALLWYGAGIPVIAAVELLPRAFYALKDTWTPVLINLVTLSIAVVLSVVGVGLVHGNAIHGVALLTGVISLTVLIEIVWLGLALRRRVHTLALRALGLSSLRSFAATGAMSVALLILLTLWKRLGHSGGRDDLLLLGIAMPLGTLTYLAWAYLVDAPELGSAWDLVRRRFGRATRTGDAGL